MIKLSVGDSMQETFELGINNVFYWIIWFFELLGALVMVAGAIYSCVKYVICQIKHKPYSIKVMIGNYMSIGLELMLVAEVLKTVITNNRTMEEFIILASIILLEQLLACLFIGSLRQKKRKWMLRIRKLKDLNKLINT